MAQRVHIIGLLSVVCIFLLVTMMPSSKDTQDVEVDTVSGQSRTPRLKIACPPGLNQGIGSFKGRNGALASFYTRFKNPSRCYCLSWHFFLNNLHTFYGEDGSTWAKRSLVSHKKTILESAKDMFTRLLNPGRGAALYSYDENALMTVDVGANVGQNAAFLADILPKEGMDMYFFEPNPLNWDMLKKTLKKYSHSHLIQKAAGERPGEVFFNGPHGENHAGNRQGHIIEGGKNPGKTAFKVDVVRLDDFFNTTDLAHRPVMFLKTDTEGFDVLVMRGAQKLLSRTRFFIYECHLFMDAKAAHGPGTTHFEAQQILSSLGFESFKISKDHWVPFSDEFYHPIIDDPKFMAWHNCIAIRRNDPILPVVFQEHNKFDECSVV